MIRYLKALKVGSVTAQIKNQKVLVLKSIPDNRLLTVIVINTLAITDRSHRIKFKPQKGPEITKNKLY